jgi:hypothetical protein
MNSQEIALGAALLVLVLGWPWFENLLGSWQAGPPDPTRNRANSPAEIRARERRSNWVIGLVFIGSGALVGYWGVYPPIRKVLAHGVNVSYHLWWFLGTSVLLVWGIAIIVGGPRFLNGDKDSSQGRMVSMIGAAVGFAAFGAFHLWASGRGYQ